MKKEQVIFFGAGVLGSLYAARMHEAGVDVTLVARGSRYDDLKNHGVVLKDFDSGEETTTPVKVVDKMPAEEYYDFCVVLVQKNQLSPKLKWVFAIPDFILTPLFQRVLRSKIADIGMARHLRNAQEEMDQLNKEFHALIEKAGIEIPVINELGRRAKAALSGSSTENLAGRNEFVTSAG